MDIENMGNGERNGKEIEQEVIVKITVSKEAENKLMEVLKIVNDGFDMGRINRQDLASWVIEKFSEGCDGDTIESIRTDHFDEFMALEAMLRKAKHERKMPPDLQSLLRQHISSNLSSKKKVKRPLAKDYINDVVKEEDGTK